MDADWNNSKIPRFVKDPNDRKKLFVKNKKKNFEIELKIFNSLFVFRI